MSWNFDWQFDWPSPATVNLEAAWQTAWENCPTSHVFQQPALSRIWVQCVAQPRGEHAVLLIAQDANHTVYLPFTVTTQKWNRLWRRDLRALGGDLVFDYQDPLVDGPKMNAEEWLAFWLELAHSSKSIKVDSVCLPHLSDSGVAENGDALFRRGANCITTTVAPSVDLRGLSDFDELLARVSQNHRSKIRRKMRAVASRDPKLMTFSGNDLPSAQLMFDAMLVAYDRQHGGESGRPHQFSDSRNINFYRRMIEEGLSAGWLHVSTLDIDGATMSWHIGFLWKRRFYWYKPCYSLNEEHALPGHLHIARLLMMGISEGWDFFDFTVGNERYKLSWTADAPAIHRLSWYPSSIRGRFHSATNKVREMLLPSIRFSKPLLPKQLIGTDLTK